MSFHEEVAEVLRDLKQDFASKPIVGGRPVDPQVREQVNADIDGLIRHRKAVKSRPTSQVF